MPKIIPRVKDGPDKQMDLCEFEAYLVHNEFQDSLSYRETLPQKNSKQNKQKKKKKKKER